MAKPKRAVGKSKNKTAPALLEFLEVRVMFAVHNDSFDVTDLTELRDTAEYSSITGSGIGIAVLDTGVDAANPDLTSKVEAFYNAVEDPVPTSISSSSVSGAVDNDGHGTHVSGIAASSDPSIGVAYGADLVDVKVIADSGESELSGDPLLRGLEFVADFASQYNIKVVNMSLGEATSSGGVNDNTVPAADDISQEIQTLESMGITVVAAAGNSYANDPVPGESYPAVVSTISVANVWSDTGSGYDFADTYGYGSAYDSWAAHETSAAPDQFAATSQRSTLANQVVAPGMDVYSDWNGTSTDNSGSDLLHNTLSGTSMAAPFVSGLVALMQQAAYTYGGRYITDPQQVLNIIKETSDQIPDPNVAGDTRVPIEDGELGTGSQPLDGTGDTYDRVNVFKAIQAVQALFTGTVSTSPTNNTIATAQTVPDLNGTAEYTEEGNIGTDGLNDVGVNDVKVYELVLDESGSLTAALSETPGGTAFTAAVRLFNSSGGQIDIAVGTSGSQYPTITTDTASPLAPGTYYLAVSSAGNVAYSIVDGSGATGGTGTGDYTLNLSLGNPDPNGVPAGAQQVDLTDPTTASSTGVSSSVFTGILGSDPPPTGSTTRVTVANGDVDMFKVIAPDTGTLTAGVDVSSYGFDGADSYVEVLDSNLNVIDQNGVDTGEPSNSEVEFNVTVGDTYYVAVTVAANAGFSPTDPYTRVAGSTETPTDYDLTLTFNNGNTDGTLLLATPATVGNTASGSISSTDPTMGSDGGDKYVDWYQYTVPSTGLLDLTATGTSAGFVPDVQLWTESVTTSGTGTTISATKIGEISGTGQSLIDQLTAGTVVYAAVTGAGNGNYSWNSLGSGSGGDTGTYTLTSSILPSSSYAALNNNSVDNGTPTPLALNTPVSANLGTDGGLLTGSTDVDLYTFTPATTGSYDIRTDTSQEGSADTVLRLFDSSGTQIALNDNASSATTASFIRATLTAGQTYYIGVSGTGNSAYDPVTGDGAVAGATGNYVVSVVASVIPAITINDPAAVQASAAGASITFTVSLDMSSSSSVTVDYATANGTAVAGTDYTATSGTLTFAAGQTSATITVPVLLNESATGTTTFDLNLTNPSSNAELDGGQGVGTITNLPVTTTLVNSHTRATYLDSDGRTVTVTMAGPGSGLVTVIGNTGANASSVTITLNDTTAKSTLSITTTRGQITDLDGLQVNGSLKTLSAAQVEMDGNLTVTGTIGDLILAGASGEYTLSVQGTGAIGSLNLGNVSDLSVTSAEPLNSVSVSQWTNLQNTDVLTAPSIRTLVSKGNFAASLAVAGAIDAVRVSKTLSAGTWNVGTVGSVVTAATAPAWSADISGDLGSMLVDTNAAGSLTAGYIGTLDVRGNLSSGTVTTTDAGTTKLPSIRTLVVGQTAADSTVRSAGTIDTVHAGSAQGSSFFAGVSADVTGLLTSASELATSASIENFDVTGIRGASTLFSSTVVDAAFLGHVSVAKVDTANAGVPFGFAADSIVSFADSQAGARPFRWNDKQPVSDLTFAGDFVVRVV